MVPEEEYIVFGRETSKSELIFIAFTVSLVVYAGALIIGHFIQRKKFLFISEASAGLLLGIACGFIGWACQATEVFAFQVSFNSTFFLLLIIPAIMFHAGYSLEVRPFFINIGSVCLTAFLGTTISTFVVGYMMWGFGVLGWCYELPAMYALTFGAIISATDPVAVLAVFESLGANPDLYINVFGESVLNDAVALVLYNTMRAYLDPAAKVTAGSVILSFFKFFGIFAGSVLIGLLVGGGAAWAFKSGFFYAEPLLNRRQDDNLFARKSAILDPNHFEIERHADHMERKSLALEKKSLALEQRSMKKTDDATTNKADGADVEGMSSAPAPAPPAQNKGWLPYLSTIPSQLRLSFRPRSSSPPASAKSAASQREAVESQASTSEEEEEQDRHHGKPQIDEMMASYETTLVLVLAYISYLFASSTFMSGITAVIVCGMVMHAYLRPNVSATSQVRISVVSKTLAIALELFAFVYIGMSVMQPQYYDIFTFVCLLMLALAVSRALNIYPICMAVNLFRPPERKISQKQMFMQWWAGLRGPMAFALALDAAENYGEKGLVMKTAVFYTVLITVVFNGGLAGYIMRYLKLRKVDDEEAEKARQLQTIQVGDSQAKGDEDSSRFGDDEAADCPPSDLPRRTKSSFATEGNVQVQLQAEHVGSESKAAESPFMKRLESWNHSIGSTLISKQLSSNSKSAAFNGKP